MKQMMPLLLMLMLVSCKKEIQGEISYRVKTTTNGLTATYTALPWRVLSTMVYDTNYLTINNVEAKSGETFVLDAQSFNDSTSVSVAIYFNDEWAASTTRYGNYTTASVSFTVPYD